MRKKLPLKGTSPGKRFLIFSILLLFTSIMGFAQTTISGRITDKDGIPLPGVNVVIKETNTGIITDIDGNYYISVDNPEQILVFSFIGYVSQEVTAGDQVVINLIMEEDIKVFDEVVVIGYGVQKKSDLTGSVASINSEDLQSTLSASLEQAMQGRAAGVRIISATGAPGSNVNVDIRGMVSINAVKPLWIVDGVGADPKSVNINDIESIEILKDASAAAIYGANAGSGVVLITTKKGSSGKPKVSFNATWSKQTFDNFIDVASGPEYGHMVTEYDALLRRRFRDYTFNGTNQPLPDSLPTYDYQRAIFRDAPMRDYNLSLSGGNEKSKYYLGIGYVTQEGILRNSGYDRLTMRVNTESKTNKWFTMGENLSIMREEYTGFEEWQLLNEYHTPIIQALNYHSFVPIYINPDRTAAAAKNDTTNWSSSPMGNTSNPLSTVELLDKKRIKNAIKATAFFKIEPIQGLSYENRLTGDFSNDFTDQFYPIFYITASYNNDHNKVYKNFGNYQGYVWQNILTYQKTLFNDHNLTLMGAYEVGYNKYEWANATRWDPINDSEEMRYFDASTDATTLAQLPSGSGSEGSGISYIGRIGYDYKGIFLSQFNFRRDGSSVFAPQKKWGNFPSFSLGLKFSELTAVKDNLPFLSFGKIRYGWGKIGNNAVPNYGFYATVSPQSVFNYSFDDTPSASTGVAPTRMGNKNLGWEGVVTNNIGLDLGFFSNRVTLTTEYFERYNDGMIMEKELLGIAGYLIRSTDHEEGISRPPTNMGRLSNKGIEFSTEVKQKIGKLNLSINANFAYIKTMALDLGGDTIQAGKTKGVSSFLNKTIEGHPIGEFWGYEVEGMFTIADCDSIDGVRVVINQPYTIDTVTGNPVYAQPYAQPGDLKFKDTNNDGIIDENDIVPIGNPNPKFIYGFGINLEGWGFDLSLFFQGVYGNKIFNATKFYLYNIDGGFNWSADYVKNHYRENTYNRDGELLYEANLDGTLPRIDPFNRNENLTRISSLYIEDGSYLRLKNITLGYTLPSEYTRKLTIEKLRVFISGTNLLTFTKYSGYDPEVGSVWKGNTNITKEDATTMGLDKGAYPRPKMYSLGINLTF